MLLALSSILLVVQAVVIQKFPSHNWMEQRWDQISNKTLKELTLPGTHDSGSWSVTSTLIDVPPFLNEMIKVADELGIPVGQIVDGWARSQTHDFYDQLMFGIRFLDVRIIYDPIMGAWRTHHGVVLGANVEVLLGHVRKFLQSNTKEVLFLEFSHPDPTNVTNQGDLESLITSYLGKYLLPASKGFVPVQEMIAAGQNVILTLPFGNSNDKFWPHSTSINSYANSPVLPTMEAYNVKKAQEFAMNRPTGQQLFKMSWTLTPSVETILEMVLPGHPQTLLELANIADKDLVSWYTSQIEPKHFSYPILGNILIIDHYDVSAIVDIVTRGM